MSLHETAEPDVVHRLMLPWQHQGLHHGSLPRPVEYTILRHPTGRAGTVFVSYRPAAPVANLGDAVSVSAICAGSETIRRQTPTLPRGGQN